METFFLAIGLILILEGTAYALAPGFVKDMAAKITVIPADLLRKIGLVCVLVGCALLWLGQNLI